MILFVNLSGGLTLSFLLTVSLRLAAMISEKWHALIVGSILIDLGANFVTG